MSIIQDRGVVIQHAVTGILGVDLRKEKVGVPDLFFCILGVDLIKEKVGVPDLHCWPFQTNVD